MGETVIVLLRASVLRLKGSRRTVTEEDDDEGGALEAASAVVAVVGGGAVAERGLFVMLLLLSSRPEESRGASSDSEAAPPPYVAVIAPHLTSVRMPLLPSDEMRTAATSLTATPMRSRDASKRRSVTAARVTVTVAAGEAEAEAERPRSELRTYVEAAACRTVGSSSAKANGLTYSEEALRARSAAVAATSTCVAASARGCPKAKRSSTVMAIASVSKTTLTSTNLLEIPILLPPPPLRRLSAVTTVAVLPCGVSRLKVRHGSASLV